MKNTIEAALDRLIKTGAANIATAMVGAGLTALAQQQRRDAPRGDTKQVLKSIGKKLNTPRPGLRTGRAGLNLSRAAALVKRPHAHLVAFGTQQRTRKKIGGKFGYLRHPTAAQLNTGTMPADPFVAEALATARAAIVAKMHAAGTRGITRLQTKH